MAAVNKAKQSFISGLLIALPILITIVIIEIVAGWTFKFINPLVRSTNLAQYTGNIDIIAQILALIASITFLTVIGYLSNYRLSHQLRATSAKIVKEIPLFGSVYATVKQISSAFTEGDDRFQKTVLVEFPIENTYSLGLITSEAPKSVEDAAADGGEMQSVFMPMSPNPTMGRLIMVEPEQYQELDMSVQKGMKLLLTTGMAYKEDELPKEIRNATKND
jgi:uncharacterized membrane protein